MQVDNNGHFLSNGSGFLLTGSLDLDGDGHADVSGTLLSGQITAFGADPAGPPTVAFDGLFKIEGGLLTQQVALSQGGTLAAPFTLGGTGFFLLDAETVRSGTLGDFTRNFSSGKNSVKSDVGQALVPGPAGWRLGLVGTVVLVGVSLMRLRNGQRRSGWRWAGSPSPHSD